ncbi:hypothetical protein [Mucilaginibacter sp.]|uniref:hypothetical protein n=1 Tax=Mucilaginibacter sp. TaxID=1882438 RepID=UPI0025F8959D|nr:hypothetical protein [Mucilaginibacter sp.]
MWFKKVILILSMAMLSVFGCRRLTGKVPFYKEKWLEREDWDYPRRDEMIDDLIKNHKLKGLRYKQMIELLGEPQGNTQDSIGVYYQIVEDFGSDIDPVYTKNLSVEFNKDSIINKVTIEEWKKP